MKQKHRPNASNTITVKGRVPRQSLYSAQFVSQNAKCVYAYRLFFCINTGILKDIDFLAEKKKNTSQNLDLNIGKSLPFEYRAVTTL